MYGTFFAYLIIISNVFVASKKDTLSFYLVRADRKASGKTTSLDKILVLSNRATWYNQNHSDQKTRTFKILYIFLFLLFFCISWNDLAQPKLAN